MKKTLLLLTLITLFFGNTQAQNWNEIIKTVASDRGVNDGFGTAVAISGNYAIVVAGGDDEDAAGLNTLSGAGSAYIFEKNGVGNWVEVQKIVASDRGAGDEFGFSVAISGNYAVVGTRWEAEDALGLNSLFGAGSAYVFERNAGGLWVEVQKLVASDRAANDHFGSSVSISGDYVIVGAAWESEDVTGLNTFTFAGSAYVFERSVGGVWNEVQKIVASDRELGDHFGESVAISGNYAIVGAYAESSDAAGLNAWNVSGSAYVFERNLGGTWNEVQKIVASDRFGFDRFGISVAISGTYAIVGAYHEDHDVAGLNFLSKAGSAYVFERNLGGTWIEVQKLVASDRGMDELFGKSIAISGNYVIVGVSVEDEDEVGLNTLTDAGSAYIFERNIGGVWTEVKKIVASDRDVNDQFGHSVTISGDYAIVGAYFEDEDAAGLNTMSFAGSAYVFSSCLATASGFNVTACGNYTVPSGDEIYSSLGTATVMDTIPNSCGKDSVMTITLTILPALTGTITTTICNEGNVVVNGTTYNATNPTGTEVITNVGPYNCDSTVTINLNILPAITGAVTTTICNEGSVVVNGTTYNTTNPAGTEVFANIGPNNCDSTVSINLNVLPALTGSVTTTLCNESTTNIIINGTTYNTTNPTGTEVFPNIGANNCDSTVSINLNVLPALTGSVTTTICIDDSVIVNGTTYNLTNPTGTEVFTNVGPNNCDSTVTISLNVLPVLTGSVTNTICNEGSIIVNGTIYNATNPTGVEVFANCDSTVTINLTVLPVKTGIVTNTICNEGSVIVNGTSYNATNPSGTEVFTNIGANNCDSTVTVTLTVLPALTGSVTTTICNEDSVVVNGTTYNAANPTGTEVFTNIGPNNCDSTVTISLNVLPVLTGTQNETVCFGGSITVNGTVYDAINLTGTEVFTVGPNNCDSTVAVTLTILPELIGSVTNTICNTDTVFVNGVAYHATNPTGTEFFTNVGVNNCDSTVTVNLNVLPVLTGSVTTTICNNDSLMINGTTYNAANSSGTEVFTNVGANNCDSVVTINLTVLSAVDTSTSTTGFVISSNQTGATYQWINCTNGNVVITGATNANYTVTANGDYAVVVTVGNCSDTSACVNISTVGVDENNRSKALRIYPNPAKDEVTISLGIVKNAQISIITITGKEVFTIENVNESQTVISLSHLNKGIYFVKVKNGEQQQVLKLIKQ